MIKPYLFAEGPDSRLEILNKINLLKFGNIAIVPETWKSGIGTKNCEVVGPAMYFYIMFGSTWRVWVLLNEKVERLWTELLSIKSIGYLVRAKIEQNISIALSNISSSFMGNRQLANHNTDDIKFNIFKICESKFDQSHAVSKSLQLRFLRHRFTLNKRLISNSEDLLSAVALLQSMHRKIMNTNEEIIRFNTSTINLTSALLADDISITNDALDDDEIEAELDKLGKECAASKKKCERIMKKVDAVFQENIKAQELIQSKRQTIMKNRKSISDSRKAINSFL